VIPEVTVADVAAVEDRIGVAFDDARRAILTSNVSFDVQACPGSGKTTLVVAKLAVLAAKWPHLRRGICVLSHTNVAREEIERRLTGTLAGQRLLAFPHFVGTIHGFVNEFLALPLLRSEGRTIKLIDDDACFEFMRRLVGTWPYRGKIGNLYYKDHTLSAHLHSLVWDCGPTGPAAPLGLTPGQAEALEALKRKAVERGHYFHADMFAVAKRLLAEVPGVVDSLLWRFPAVFLDEMQDTSELQGQVLASIFPLGKCRLRQRFGDINQAIFDTGQAAAKTDPFPAGDVRSIPNSKRFGWDIAGKVYSLAPCQVQPSLVGEGPPKWPHFVTLPEAAMPHTVFLFGPDSAAKVLPTFGKLLLESFPDDVLRSPIFLARAIGRRHKKGEEGSQKFPCRLGDYWPDYKPQAARTDPRPESLADYVHLAQRHRAASVDCTAAVRLAVRGIAELVEVLCPAKFASVTNSTQRSRGVTGHLLGVSPALREVLWRWCIAATSCSEATWPGEITALRAALEPITGGAWTNEADRFCMWSQCLASPTPAGSEGQLATLNRFRFRDGSRYVDIDVGTVHSAKGQTHTATLVLETYYKRHDLDDLMDWLVHKRCGATGDEGVERLERMRLIYTAMTRPTHLLCLAISASGTGEASSETVVGRLGELGWKVRTL